MARTQTVSLGDHWNHFVNHLVESGRFASASEVMRESLRLMEEKEARSKLKALQKALIDGEESGMAGKLEMEDIKRQARQKVGLPPSNV